MWALTVVVLPFSFAIAILKDVPDAEGDRRFRIMTFTVRVGGAKVLRAGLAVLALAYVGMAMLGPLLIPEAQPWVLAGGHLAALALLLGWAAGRGPRRPGGLHALLHARVEAVLPRVRARRARLPGGLALRLRRQASTAIRAAIAPASAIGIAVRSFEPRDSSTS